MNSPTDSGGSQQGRIRGARPTRRPRSDAQPVPQFVVAVLGSFFVFQLDVNYLWLTALLTVAGMVLGIMLLVRAVKFKESRLVLFGTHLRAGGLRGDAAAGPGLRAVLQPDPGLPAVRRHALTQQATSACQTQLQNSLPTQLR